MNSSDHTRALVERAQAGERGAFDALCLEHRPRLEALVRARMGLHLRDRVTSDDIVQEALLAAWQSLEHFRWEGPDSFMRWLGGVTENVLRNESRRRERSRKIRIEPASRDQVSPSRAMRREERLGRLEAAIEKLRGDHRTVIMLSRIEGLPTREIARRMNRSESAVKNLLLRALRELKTGFGDTESMRLPETPLGREEDHER